MSTWRSLTPLVALALAVGVQAAPAGPWPRLGESLERWAGPREAMLLTDRDDPLASREIQEILDLLSSYGFTTRVLRPGSPGGGHGLAVDLRLSETGASVALIRATDGAILSFERRGPDERPSAGAPPRLSGRIEDENRRETPGRSGQSFPIQTRLALGPFQLPRPAAQIGVLREAGESLELLLLRDESLDTVTLAADGIQAGASFAPPVRPTRALHADVVDLDGDARPEILATWGEDESGVYVGRNTRLHSWVLVQDGAGIRATSDDLHAYLRAARAGGIAQSRGADDPWVGPIRALGRGDRGFVLETDAPWPFENLWQGLPWTDDLALLWDRPGRLASASPRSGQSLPGGVLLADLGTFRGPEVAVRLKNPEFLSGFAKEDQVRERLHELPRRIAIGPDGAAYTILRGRSPGLPLVGKPSGQDRIVRLTNEGSGLHLTTPFDPVDAFVLDFALAPSTEGPPRAVLLLSDGERGEGTNYVLVMEGRL